MMNREYFVLMRKLWEEGINTSPRGMKTKELFNYTLRLDVPACSKVTIPGFETNISYAEAELDWYFSGGNRMDGLGRFGKCWQGFSDDGVHVNSAYGHRIFGKHPKVKLNQWQWCVKKLREDPDTRQAVINLNAAFDKAKPTKDFVCTVFCQMLARRGRLHWFTYMRSTDAFLGIRNDVFCFTGMQRVMAKQLGLALGKYYHTATSTHLYEKQFKKARELCEKHYPVRAYANTVYKLDVRAIKDKHWKTLGWE